MKIDLPAGKYVVAVSGGVDSVALLHMLAQNMHTERRVKSSEGTPPSAVRRAPFAFVVAHFDHGIREDSAKDRQLVAALAKKYGLPFVYHTGRMGAGTSEAAARKARYEFLHQVRKASGADAILTAHHQDDVLETAILNMLRGTGRRGLSSLKSTDIIKRPLLHVPKTALKQYAVDNHLEWREDSTNGDEAYLRNYVRRRIVPRFQASDRQRLLDIISTAHHTNAAIEQQLDEYLEVYASKRELNRHYFVQLPHAVAREVLARWLQINTDVELTTKLLERLVAAAKTGKIGSKADVNAGFWLTISGETLALRPRER